jgi:hypothetical protein
MIEDVFLEDVVQYEARIRGVFRWRRARPICLIGCGLSFGNVPVAGRRERKRRAVDLTVKISPKKGSQLSGRRYVIVNAQIAVSKSADYMRCKRLKPRIIQVPA